MQFFISKITVGQATTIINVIITFINHSLSLSLAALLVFFIPKVNSAPTWNLISRTIHSTLWPTIFRLDPDKGNKTSSVVVTVERLAIITAILIPITGITLPLGLHTGPFVPLSYKPMEAKYVPDKSGLGLGTTPNRHEYQHGRICGLFYNSGRKPCPGNGNDKYNTSYAQYIIDVFNSIPYGPFSMQYRGFYNGGKGNVNISTGLFGTSQSFISRNDTFAVEDLLVDMSFAHPGIGFWNQTMPDLEYGGTWSQNILWLEPVTKCVNTNLTIDYILDAVETTQLEGGRNVGKKRTLLSAAGGCGADSRLVQRSPASVFPTLSSSPFYFEGSSHN